MLYPILLRVEADTAADVEKSARAAGVPQSYLLRGLLADGLARLYALPARERPAATRMIARHGAPLDIARARGGAAVARE